MKTDLYIEFDGHKTDYRQLIDTAKEIWKSEGNKVKDLTSLELYFKPDGAVCYYVINGTSQGHFEV